MKSSIRRRLARKSIAASAGMLLLTSFGFAGGRYRIICEEDEPFRHYVNVDLAIVDAVTGKGQYELQGGVGVSVPAHPERLEFTCGHEPSGGDVHFDSVAEGDLVDVVGALRGDGSILAYRVHVISDASPLGLSRASGVVESVEYDGGEPGLRVPLRLSVGGVEYGVDPDAEIHGNDTPGDVADGVLEGDAVFLLFREAESEAKTVVELRVRASGEDTELAGVIDSVDEDSLEFVVSGLPCRRVARSVVRIDESLDGDYVQPGRRVAVSGLLRAGVVLVREMTIDPPASSSSQAKRNGRLRASGRVDAVGTEAVRVSGLDLPLGDRKPDAALAALAEGDLVAVKAKIRGGAIERPRLIRRR